MAEMTKGCMELIMPILMRTAGGPEMFEDLNFSDNVVSKDEGICH